MRKAFGTSAAVAILVIGVVAPPVSRAQQAQSAAIQTAFQTADRIPRRAMSDAAWRAAKRVSSSRTFRSYGVSYIPHVVLIDRSRIVRFAKVGSADSRELEQQIVRLLAERERPRE